MATKFVPFEEIEKLATIERLAQMLNLDIRRSGSQWRCECPTHPGHHRDLCISPQIKSKRGSLGVFYCQRDKTGGDRIGLVAHVMDIGQQDAALFIAQQFGMEFANSKPVTSKQVEQVTVCEERATVPPARKEASDKGGANRPFDPAAFASKLEYSAEVQALGYTEQEAADFGIGSHRGAVYKAARYASGVTAGFWKHQDGKWVAPKQWLPDVKADNVISLRQRA